ncbi:hypothetical protein [Bradyrhizobium uaiense]|uniref:Uncharacterized protein n=1 Tax=Bradyrhizobium uaiense TaxID=2594946 RepID=A0A6P1BAP2_9BRAD|nr:hypothetical protein [Bradyrhizobium uaiense]NEU95264.1 hypothetical protein [Bradyrhizobium uaiense]
MGGVILFVSKSERERVRLIREARAIYESIFPAEDRISEPKSGTLDGHADRGVDEYHRNGVHS